VLKPGMTGVAKIYVEWSHVGIVFTRDVVRFILIEISPWWL
jgi:hypothetical protein